MCNWLFCLEVLMLLSFRWCQISKWKQYRSYSYRRSWVSVKRVYLKIWSCWNFTDSQYGWGWQGLKPFSSRVPSIVSRWLWKPPGRRSHGLFGQPVSVLSFLHSTQVLPDGHKEPPVLQSVPSASGPGTGHLWQEPGSVLFTLFRYF